MTDKLNFKAIVIELTKKCNLRCCYCYAFSENTFQEERLSVSSLKDFFYRFHKSGGKSVSLTGGEIFLRKDIHDIIRQAKEANLLVNIFTNGTLLEKSDVIFIKKYVNLVNISLDGPEENHERLRGVKTSYRSTLETIKLFHQYKINYLIQTMMTPDTLYHYGWLIDIIKNYQPMMVKLGNVCKVGKGTNQKELFLNQQEVIELKKIAGDICANVDFHTRIMTNIVTKEEFEIFYPSLSKVITPWMLPNGEIVSCYTNDNIDFWSLSNIDTYPQTSEKSILNRDKLVETVYEAVRKKQYFELLELISEVSNKVVNEIKEGKVYEYR